jgi:hypothetical protein
MLPLPGLLQTIHNHDVVTSALIQAPDDGASDEPRSPVTSTRQFCMEPREPAAWGIRRYQGVRILASD